MLLLLSESKIYYMVATDSMISTLILVRIGHQAKKMKKGIYKHRLAIQWRHMYLLFSAMKIEKVWITYNYSKWNKWQVVPEEFK
jgi:hypothetical protein